MVGLLDVAPSTEFVMVRGTKVAIPGVSVSGIAHLIRRFPEVRKMFGGATKPGTDETEFAFTGDVDQILALAPDVVAAVIACGCGNVGDPQAEAIAAGMSADEQLRIIEKIVAVTMPGGARPFVERLTAIMQTAAADSGKA
jgi:hypothetical protein